MRITDRTVIVHHQASTFHHCLQVSILHQISISITNMRKQSYTVNESERISSHAFRYNRLSVGSTAGPNQNVIPIKIRARFWIIRQRQLSCRLLLYAANKRRLHVAACPSSSLWFDVDYNTPAPSIDTWRSMNKWHSNVSCLGICHLSNPKCQYYY